MFEINLCCPYCGGYVWDKEENEGGEDKFICVECNGTCFQEEMNVQVFEMPGV